MLDIILGLTKQRHTRIIPSGKRMRIQVSKDDWKIYFYSDIIEIQCPNPLNQHQKFQLASLDSIIVEGKMSKILISSCSII